MLEWISTQNMFRGHGTLTKMVAFRKISTRSLKRDIPDEIFPNISARY